MKKRKGRGAAGFLFVAGALLALIALLQLVTTQPLLQFAVVPTGDPEEAVSRALEVKRETADQLADCTSAVAVGAVTEKSSVSASGGSQTAVVYAVGEGWFEVDPVFLTEGRRITETELRLGEKVCMLDEELAFQLFGSEIPENAKAQIGGIEYQVAGVYRHRRSVGEIAQYSAVIPLLSANEVERDVLMIAAKPIPNSGARTMFESVMRTGWDDNGSFYCMEKESLRQMMLVRMLLLVFGMSFILRLFRWMNGVAGYWWARFQQKLRWSYFRSAWPTLAACILIALLGYGALLAILYGLAAFSIQPLYTFTEWVPENVVEWSSLRDVFWNLANTSAKLVKVGTRELRIVEFWGRLLRWGTLSALFGALLFRKSQKN